MKKKKGDKQKERIIGDRLNRRDVLKGMLGAGVAGSLTRTVAEAAPPSFSPADPQRIVRENEKPGTTDWLLKNTRIDPKTKYRCPWIEGYCNRPSVRAGESLDIIVSTNPPSPFRIDLYRLGYYGGKGGRHLRTLGPFQGKTQPDPPVGEQRLRECRWDPCTTITIPDDWISGVYLGKLTAERDGLQSYVIFTVCDDRRADFLFQCSVTTWNAYNRWPDHFSLYDDGKKRWYVGPNVRISFDRPYGKYCQIFDVPLSTGSGEFLLWEFPMAFWMEQHGYDVTYITNIETHTDAAGLLRAKSFLSVGHDEYWSLPMFHNVKNAVRTGLNVAFFSGDTCWGLIEFGPGFSGTPNRVFSRVDHFGSMDAVNPESFPEIKLFPHKGPDQATLIGARDTYPVTGGGDWICNDPDHWIFEGTGMKKGEGIPGLVGWEWEGSPANIPGLRVVARGPTDNGRVQGEYTATIYPGPKGNFVFNASTIWWGDGLSEPPGYTRPKVYTEPKGPDPRVQRITKNILDRMKA